MALVILNLYRLLQYYVWIVLRLINLAEIIKSMFDNTFRNYGKHVDYSNSTKLISTKIIEMFPFSPLTPTHPLQSNVTVRVTSYVGSTYQVHSMRENKLFILVRLLKERKKKLFNCRTK